MPLTVIVRESKSQSITIEKYDYGFRFRIGKNSNTYFVKPDKGNPHAFLVVEESNGEAKEVFGDLYANLGVKNICGLFAKMVLQPEESVYMLLGKRYRIAKVNVVNYSQTAKDGFEECVFADFITPEQLLNAKPEG
jgi:hypothetical protein